ncbi:hypothetical protein L3X38_037289 [Prunus dulcis]|uniref:Uncharacterized protein n=1 Tax=Prunus dulcis TaxID=3755 RepID=A0AAD4V569_PRUDU|nr:hypothetical protein L3X38_037289 [Prunus dulcis]
MTGASSSSNPSQVPPPATAVSPETGEEAAGVVRTSPPSISLLRPPIPTSEVWFLTYFSCSSCLLGRIGSILSVGNSIYELKFGRFWDRDSGHFRSVFGIGPKTKVAPNRVLYLG